VTYHRLSGVEQGETSTSLGGKSIRKEMEFQSLGGKKQKFVGKRIKGSRGVVRSVERNPNFCTWVNTLRKEKRRIRGGGGRVKKRGGLEKKEESPSDKRKGGCWSKKKLNND